ncbi:MAG: hypothetical protein M5U01_15950 [Ardenticatenaceae bacterium]|nr:hypothetical protein [Ardenticatenaceae bacterium]HBY95976.1 hypothetical protein [Chloroflexota bacterium]
MPAKGKLPLWSGLLVGLLLCIVIWGIVRDRKAAGHPLMQISACGQLQHLVKEETVDGSASIRILGSHPELQMEV